MLGHNNPPHGAQMLFEKFDSELSEAVAWQDGAKVENDGQEAVIDALVKSVKAIKKEFEGEKENATRSLKNAYDSENLAWLASLKIIQGHIDGLGALALPYKQEKIKAKEQAEAEARKAVWLANQEASKAKTALDISNIDARKEAEEFALAYRMAQGNLREIKAEKVTGIARVKKPQIDNPKLVVQWIWKHDNHELMEFLNSYVSKKSRGDGSWLFGKDGANGVIEIEEIVSR